MPRQLLHRRYWDRVQSFLASRRLGVRAAWGALTQPPFFIDYWTDVPATLPEKMIFAELIRRQINFYFFYYWGDMPFTDDKSERLRPDFILYDYRVIIEVAGVYWHSRPGMYEYDANKVAMYIAAGYEVYIFTDLEILNDVVATLDRVPALLYGTIHGNNFLVGDRPFDPVASITGRMRRFPKVVKLRWKRSVRGRVGVRSAFDPQRSPGKPPPPIERVFTQEDFPASYVQELVNFGQDWLKYLEELGKFFEKKKRRAKYPKEWEYYQRWRTWWDRFSGPPAS